MLFKNLSEWTTYIYSLNREEICLGLERIHKVALQLKIFPLDITTIVIGGTNGKGSTVAGLESIYKEQGYKVGAFTSPYLVRLNEEFRLNGNEVTDEVISEAFSLIENARGSISLTPFEFKTLAALLIFKKAEVEIMLLEVGLGGRLDAVNIVNADVAITTSIGIDHEKFLGNTREAIGKEKAGIYRSHQPVICGDREPPGSLLQTAQELNCHFYYLGNDFEFFKKENNWGWRSKNLFLENLPLTTLALENMSVVLKTIEVLQDKLPVSEKAIYNGLGQVKLAGRIQIIPGDVIKIFDVAHNPAAAKFLKEKLITMNIKGKTRAVFSMLADKDILTTLMELKSLIQEWYIAPLKCERATSLAELQNYFKKVDIANYKVFSSVATAYQQALKESHKNDCVISFGSFYTVGEILFREIAV